MTEVFEAKLRKIGNSLGVLIPATIIEELNFHQGDVIHLAIPPSDNGKRNELILDLAGIDFKKPSFKREKKDRF
jgi:antitoxin component of MazEF toxin-antitoxin module